MNKYLMGTAEGGIGPEVQRHLSFDAEEGEVTRM